MKPAFLITIDTEGDHLWSSPREITTRNALFLGRFQQLCERYELKPTYLVDYEMAESPDFQQLGRDILRRGTGEIGGHLHAWNNPPLVALTPDDGQRQPYLCEYPPAVMKAKIHALTSRLEEVFQTPLVSHRAGRWALDGLYARLLDERGYRVDCSVLPGERWTVATTDPSRPVTLDFRGFPDQPYFLDFDNLRVPGTSHLLELPMTVRPRRPTLERLREAWEPNGAVRRGLDRILPRRLDWLRPNGRNLNRLLGLLNTVRAERHPYAQFMLHSSEFMPGGSPTFRTPAHIERLHANLETLFAAARRHFRGMTLQEFYDAFANASV